MSRRSGDRRGRCLEAVTPCAMRHAPRARPEDGDGRGAWGAAAGLRGARRAVGAACGVGDTRKRPRREGSRAHGAQRAQEGAEGQPDASDAPRPCTGTARAHTRTRALVHWHTGAHWRHRPPPRPPRGGRPAWPLTVVPRGRYPYPGCAVRESRDPSGQARQSGFVLLECAVDPLNGSTAVQLPDLARRSTRSPWSLRGAEAEGQGYRAVRSSDTRSTMHAMHICTHAWRG